MNYEPLWPEIFNTQDLSSRKDNELVADLLCAWALCSTGNDPHKNFGEVMAAASDRLGFPVSGDNLMKWEPA